jgi:hypothetical protein
MCPYFISLILNLCAYYDIYLVYIERANMHCRGNECTRSIDIGLTSAEGKKLECFKWIANNENLVNLSYNKVMCPYFISLRLYLCTYNDLYFVYTERANMHCQGNARTRSTGIGLTSAEGKKLVF